MVFKDNGYAPIDIVGRDKLASNNFSGFHHGSIMTSINSEAVLEINYTEEDSQDFKRQKKSDQKDEILTIDELRELIQEERKSRGRCCEVLSYLFYSRFITKNFKLVVLISSSLLFSFFLAIPISMRVSDTAFDYDFFISCSNLADLTTFSGASWQGISWCAMQSLDSCFSF